VDGKPVSFRTVVQALLNGKDVTAQLKKAGLSDAQIAYTPAFGEQRKVVKLTAQQRQQLIQLHLIGEGPTAEIRNLSGIFRSTTYGSRSSRQQSRARAPRIQTIHQRRPRRLGHG
jgi:hypothetical protein